MRVRLGVAEEIDSLAGGVVLAESVLIRLILEQERGGLWCGGVDRHPQWQGKIAQVARHVLGGGIHQIRTVEQELVVKRDRSFHQTAHDDGLTIIVVTHSEELAMRAERRIHLLDGRISDDKVQGKTRVA